VRCFELHIRWIFLSSGYSHPTHVQPCTYRSPLLCPTGNPARVKLAILRVKPVGQWSTRIIAVGTRSLVTRCYMYPTPGREHKTRTPQRQCRVSQVLSSYFFPFVMNVTSTTVRKNIADAPNKASGQLTKSPTGSRKRRAIYAYAIFIRLRRRPLFQQQDAQQSCAGWTPSEPSPPWKP